MSIQASLRRPVLPTQDRGHIISDSAKKKAAIPTLNMDAGIVRPVFKFHDGEGLTDAFGNVYDGYNNNAGSHSFSYVHSPAQSISSALDTTSSDGDLIQYNSTTGNYEAKSFAEVGLAPTDEGTSDGQIAVWNDTLGKYEAIDLQTTVPSFISYIIEIPQDRTYRLVQNLPFDIIITGTIDSIVTGPASVSFPSGTITAGNPVDIIVSATSGASEFLRIQINFTRVIDI